MTSTAPFDGIRVLDVGHIIAGPIAGSILGDFGADVIKVERPVTGDPLRWAYRKDGVGLFYKVQARNKRCITLDMDSGRGREVFQRLVSLSDVVIENFRPGVMEEWGHDWETLRSINPGLVYCRLSGFGQTGPYSSRRAYGRIGEAFAGFAHLTGESEGPPMHSAMSLGDTIAGVWAAMGIMMALYWRDAQGGDVGQVIDVGLYEPLFRQIEQQIVVADQLGQVLSRIGNENPGIPYVGSFQTKDNRYFSFSALTEQSIHDLLSAMDLEDDPRYNDFDECLRHRSEFQAAVSSWMAQRTLEEVRAAFDRFDAPGGPVMHAGDLIEDPHVIAREMIMSVLDDELGSIKMPGVVPKLSRSPGKVRHAGQRLGQSNREVYCGLLDLTEAEVASLTTDGVF